jgi:ABC-type transporter Mla maintaining outer membrane lipid asymmetry permease subunit MlaE
MLLLKLLHRYLTTFGRYLILMGRTFARPERMRMFLKRYVKEMSQLGVDSIAIVLMISFFIGAVICIQMKVNISSPWMPRWTTGYTTREIMLLEFSSSIMCLILSGKVGSNIASELGTMRVTQQIDALDIMGVNSASYLILPKILGLVTIMPFLVIFSSAMGIIGAYATAIIARRSHGGHAPRFQSLVYVDEHHQESVLRLHHLQRIVLFRLHSGGRLRRGGQGFHRCRRLQQCAHPLLRRFPYAITELSHDRSQKSNKTL